MDKYVTQVKRHKHKNKYQYLITFTGDHGFEYEEPVIVMKNPFFNEFEKEFNSLRNQDTLHKEELHTLENERDEFKDRAVKSEGKVKELEGELSGLRDRINELESMEREDYKTKYEDLLQDHLSQGKELNTSQGNLSKAFGVIALQNKEIIYYRNRPFTHKLLGRLPEEIKDLQESHNIYDTPEDKKEGNGKEEGKHGE